jgi:hypothetical protein
MKIININDFKKISDIIMGQEYDSGINRYRSSHLYRGMPNSNYSLVTSLKRNCKDKQIELEDSILRNFTKYAATEDPQLKDSIWRQQILGQHHGLPTRLLDWTYSPLMGLHFATSGEDSVHMDQHDSVLWRIDINELNSLLPLKYKQELFKERAYLFTVEMLDSLVDSIAGYDEDMKNNSLVLLEPPSIDSRIINQYSYFSVIPKDISDIEAFLKTETKNTVKYILDKSVKWRIRDMLDQMNVNERIAYPGLDGLTMWLKRHYYVK